MTVSRFSVSLEEELLEALDAYVKENQFPNRSQAIRALIEKNRVEKKWQCNNLVAGAIVLVHPNSRKEVWNRSFELQTQYSEVVLSSQRFFIENDHTMEVITVKGSAHTLTELSDQLIGIKGIEHGKLIMSKVR
ncbi:MAG: ribbon-helix-helix protein, CopG family [Prolixibacteraceae bacterium]|jgi:CopG family transcriptional regulator, nickel-responsive regulator